MHRMNTSSSAAARPSVVLAALAIPVALVALSAVGGCERQSSSTHEKPAERVGEAHSYTLMIPAMTPDGGPKTPGVRMSIAVRGLEASAATALREPLGNVVYRSIKGCESVYPERGLRSRVDLRFELDGSTIRGAATDTFGNPASVPAPLASRGARRCVAEALGERTLPEDAPPGDRAGVEVKVSSIMQW